MPYRLFGHWLRRPGPGPLRGHDAGLRPVLEPPVAQLSCADKHRLEEGTGRPVMERLRVSRCHKKTSTPDARVQDTSKQNRTAHRAQHLTVLPVLPLHFSGFQKGRKRLEGHQPGGGCSCMRSGVEYDLGIWFGSAMCTLSADLIRLGHARTRLQAHPGPSPLRSTRPLRSSSSPTVYPRLSASAGLRTLSYGR